jgi:glutathione S-transferase
LIVALINALFHSRTTSNNRGYAVSEMERHSFRSPSEDRLLAFANILRRRIELPGRNAVPGGSRRNVMGLHFTAADAHFFWRFRRGSQFDLDLSKFANCSAHFERMRARTSVQKLLAYERAIKQEFAQAA